MSMLKCFFEVGADPALFDGLKIMQEKELCEKYMGKFPVISISLKDVDGRDFESASAALRTIIGNEAARFRFLNSSDRLTDDEKESYAQLTEVGSSQGGIYTMTEKVAAASLKTLSQLLSRHFGQKVILLIDEYDVPLDKAFQSGYYDEMLSLMRNVLGNALKTNDSLYFAVLTGCLRISKESIFTGLNNLKIHTISDVRYDEFFGFTNSDVDELLESYGLSSYKGVIRDWYDGYRFGDTDVYCPWDVINYCDELLADPIAPPKNYWANTSGNDLILRLLKKADQTTKDEVEELISNGKITQRIKQELTYRDIDDSVENVWSVLYAAGYLTGKHVEQADADIFSLWIPNGEIRKLFSDLIKDWFQEITRADSTRINRFCTAFPEGDVSMIQEMLSDYLWDSISVRDTAVRRNMKENFYHGVLLGILNFRTDWYITSNREAGEGYNDILIAHERARIGMIIEVKYAENDNLENECAGALAQIEKLHYTDALSEFEPTKIYKYAIACYKKHCKVTMTEETWQK